MAIKMVLESLDDVPEALHAFYAEKDGKFILEADGMDEHPAVANLRNAYRAEQEKRRKAAEDLRQATERLSVLPEEFDPDEWDRLRAEDEARANDPEGKNIRKQIEEAQKTARDSMETRLAAERKKWDAEKQSLIADRDNERGYSVTQLRESTFRAAMSKNNMKSGLQDYFMAKHSPMTELVEEDGQRQIRMKPEFGGGAVDEFVANFLQADGGKDFITPASGSDAPGNNGRGGGQSRKAGDFGGSRDERKQAIAARFPEIAKAG